MYQKSFILCCHLVTGNVTCWHLLARKQSPLNKTCTAQWGHFVEIFFLFLPSQHTLPIAGKKTQNQRKYFGSISANAVITEESRAWLLWVGWLHSKVIIREHFWEGNFCKHPLNQFLPVGKHIHQKARLQNSWEKIPSWLFYHYGKATWNKQRACDFPLSVTWRKRHFAWDEIQAWITRCYRALYPDVPTAWL